MAELEAQQMLSPKSNDKAKTRSKNNYFKTLELPKA